jgi:hypothetical protein
MSHNHYEFGHRNGTVPLGAEYGSEAWNDAMRGANDARQAAQIADNERYRREADAASAVGRRSNQTGDGTAALAPFAIVAVGGYVAVQLLQRWQVLPLPYKWIAAFYYYLIVLPLSQFGGIWSGAGSLVASDRTVLSVLTSTLGCLVYAFGLIVAAGLILGLLKAIKLYPYRWLILLGPACFAALWAIGVKLLR